MKNIVRLGKRWLKNSPGFTLVELMVAMTVGSFVVGGALTVMTQLFDVTATNSNYMAAFRQVQNSGDWISQDALMTQQVYVMDTNPATGDIMDPATLAGDISDTIDVITVDSTASFPPSGVICIDNELIFYTDKTDSTSTFGTVAEPVTRGTNATDHDAGADVTFFVHLGWTDWSGGQHQVVYNLKEISRQLLRSHYMKEKAEEGEPENDFELQSSTIVGEAIDPAETSSGWVYDDKELTIVITAQIRDEAATRTYRVHPRPLF